MDRQPENRARRSRARPVLTARFPSGKRFPMIMITDGDSTIICRPLGEVESLSALTLRHIVTNLPRPDLKIAIDLRHAHDVDGVGLRVLIGMARGGRCLGRTARLVNVNPRARCLLRSVGAGRLIELSATRQRPMRRDVLRPLANGRCARPRQARATAANRETETGLSSAREVSRSTDDAPSILTVGGDPGNRAD